MNCDDCVRASAKSVVVNVRHAECPLSGLVGRGRACWTA